MHRIAVFLLIILMGCTLLDKFQSGDKANAQIPQIVQPTITDSVKKEEIIIPTLNKKNENNTQIESIKLRPVCREAKNAAELYFKVKTLPADFAIQLKEVGQNYSNILQKKGLFEKFYYFIICDACRTEDIMLKQDKVYIMRMMFNQSKLDKIEYSNEYLIDTRNESGYRSLKCESDKIKIKSW